VLEGLLILLVLLPPMAFGAAATWAKHSIFLGAVILLSLWLFRASRSGFLTVRGGSLWWPVVLFLLYGILQQIPLPAGVLAGISPSTSLLLSETLTGPVGAKPLSISPRDTLETLLLFSAMAIVLFVVVNFVRGRPRITRILSALVLLGVFEALFGMSEQLTGSRQIFWNPRTQYLGFVTGTYHNKNFFSGLLEMIVPAAIGLLIALSRDRVEGKDRPAARGGLGPGLARVISSPRLAQQFLLAAASVVMILAVFFSLSRAGIVSLMAAMAGIAVLVSLSSGFRRYTVVPFLLAGVTLSIGSAVGMDRVIRRMEDVVAGHSDSWVHRLDMMQSALGAAKDFPLFGTGLGTLGRIFPRYQSKQLGDVWADYIHNDWLQLFCEAGALGWMIAVLGLLVFFVIVTGRAARRKDAFARFVSAGLLLGVAAMLLHSFFEHNLGKIPANLLVFTVLSGLAFSAAHVTSRRGRVETIELCVALSTPSRRWCTSLVALLLVAAGASLALPAIRADILFNRALAASTGRPELYFFLPLEGGREDGDELLKRAVALDPANPKYHSHSALRAQAKAEEAVRERAARSARDLVGAEVEKEDPEGFEEIVDIMREGALPLVWETRLPLLEEAHDSLLRVTGLTPTEAGAHLRLAGVLLELGSPAEEVRREVAIARGLAPQVPGIQFGAAGILLSLLSQKMDGPEEEELRGEALTALRRAIYIDPSYVEKAYPLFQGVVMSGENVLEEMPPSISAHESLYLILEGDKRWETALAALGEIERLADVKFSPSREEAKAADAEWESYTTVDRGYDRRSELDVRFSLAERRSRLLGILGRWPERADALSIYRGFLRERLREDLEDVRRIRRQGRAGEAMLRVRMILEEDWAFPEANLEAAEIASLPETGDSLPPGQKPLDHLVRLVLHNDGLSEEDARRAATILAGEEAATEAERVKSAFLAGALDLLSGRAKEAVGKLKKLAGANKGPSRWRQGHLVWYYLGLGYERAGERDEAAEAYGRALGLVDSHRPSLLRLSSLQKKAAAALKKFEPERVLNINFGGRVILLGYTAREADKRGSVSIRYYWQFIDRMDPEYWPLLHFGGIDGEPTFEHSHRITAAGREYPVDFPRSGEVVVEDYTLPRDPMTEPFLRAAIWMTELLYHDGGRGFVVASLRGDGPF
jgi:O-antigen ligase/tetratricopeptide (TPR) repeat protein